MNPYNDSKCRGFCNQYSGCMGWSNAKKEQGGCVLYFKSDAWELTKYPSALPGFSKCGPYCPTNIRTSVNSQCKEAGAFIEYGGSEGKSSWIQNHFCYRKAGSQYTARNHVISSFTVMLGSGCLQQSPPPRGLSLFLLEPNPAFAV